MKAVVFPGQGAQRRGMGVDLFERYPRLVEQADAVLGFDDYPDIADRLRRIVQGERPVAHTPSDRRHLLPISPVDRPAVAAVVPGHGDVVGSPSPAPGWQPMTWIAAFTSLK